MVYVFLSQVHNPLTFFNLKILKDAFTNFTVNSQYLQALHSRKKAIAYIVIRYSTSAQLWG